MQTSGWNFRSVSNVRNLFVAKVYRNSQRELLFGAPSVNHLPEALRQVERPVAAPGAQED